jgi:hypothetical protein
MVEVEKMVETFREMRNLFLTSQVSVFFFSFLVWFGVGADGHWFGVDESV